MIAAFSMAAVVTPLATAPASAMQNKVIVDFETQNYVVTPFDWKDQSVYEQAASVVTDAPGNATHSLKNTRGYQGWAGTTFFNSAGTQLVSEGNLSVTAEINAPVAGVVIRLKVEDANNNQHTLETNATETSVTGWHTYTFDMSAQATGTAAFDSSYNYDKASFFFDFTTDPAAVTSNGQDFFLDNVTFPGETTPAVGVDFETVGEYAADAFDWVPGDVTGKDPQAASVVTDAPDNSTKVLKSTRGYQGWAGTTFFSKTNTVLISEGDLVATAEINAPAAGVVLRMKLENGLDNSMTVETNATETSVTGWHTYTFDFANEASGTSAFSVAKTYDKASLFFDFTTDPSLVTTYGLNYYMDNVIFPGAVTPAVVSTAPSTLATFESGDAAAIDVANKATPEHTLGVFGGDSNVAAIADAPAGGKGGKVLAITKNGESWSGINAIADETGTVRYTNADHPVVSFNYYAPHAGPVVVELGPAKVQATAQALKGWQTISIDFSDAQQVTFGTWSASTDYRKVSIFPDFLVAAAGNTFYFDDIAVNGATTPHIDYVAPSEAVANSTLLTFESGDLASLDVANPASNEHPLGVFGGNANVAAIADGPVRGNMSKVLAITKAGETWTGFNAVKDASGDVRFTTAEHPVVSFNYYAPHAGPVAVELSPGPVHAQVQAVAGWQTISIDFSNASLITSGAWSSATDYTAVSIFPDFLVAVSNPADVYYFDNIAVNGATTPAVQPVVLTKPVNTKSASLSGTAKVGKTLTAAKGTWTANPTATISYKWYRCSVKGSSITHAAPTKSAKCSVISRKTASTYKLTSADKGKFIRASVIAHNSKGTTITTTKTTTKAVVK